MKASRRGPRGRDAGTSEEIVAVARSQFAQRGYARTTIHSVAAEAGVDPALVMYFHGSKRELFLAAAAIPFELRVCRSIPIKACPDNRCERVQPDCRVKG